METKLSHLELFAGIGGFRRAIDLFCTDNNLQSHCVGYSEIDKYASASYRANYDTDGEVELGDIEKFIADPSSVESLPDFDLLTGGFPCQAFSMMGKQRGFEDTRGNVFYAIINILVKKKPKYVLLENVRNLRSHDQGRTFKEVIRSLEEDAGYNVVSDIFNTSDFGLPQHRRRIFILAVRKDLKKDSEIIKHFSSKLVLEAFESHKGSTILNFYKDVLDGILEKNADSKYYLSEKIKPTILANGSKNFKSNSEINQLIARPLTATMVKMHRACQDNYYSDNFLRSRNPYKYVEKSISKEVEVGHNIRKITPREAFLLQGFDRSFSSLASDAGISNHQQYRQAGNAVSVNTVYAIISYIFNFFNSHNS